MFLPQTSRLLGALSAPQLNAHLRVALELNPSAPQWLKARWRSYLSHLRFSLLVEREEAGVTLHTRELGAGLEVGLEAGLEVRLEVLLRLCELLCAVTPLELQPSEEEVARWLEAALGQSRSPHPQEAPQLAQAPLSALRKTHRATLYQELREGLSALPVCDLLS